MFDDGAHDASHRLAVGDLAELQVSAARIARAEGCAGAGDRLIQLDPAAPAPPDQLGDQPAELEKHEGERNEHPHQDGDQ